MRITVQRSRKSVVADKVVVLCLSLGDVDLLRQQNKVLGLEPQGSSA